MKKNITINTNEAHINGNSKGVRCLTDGKYYPRVKDAAQAHGVANSSMSYAISHKTLCKGKEFRFESDSEYNMMKMASNLEEYRTKALAYDLLMAKKREEEERAEKIRKEKEAHELKISKAKEKIARLTAECERKEAKLQMSVGKLMEAERELKDLMGDEVCGNS